MHLVRVHPNPGRHVMLPGSRSRLPPEGAVVEYTAHWQRRAADGDVRVEALEGSQAAGPKPQDEQARPALELEAPAAAENPNPKTAGQRRKV